MKLLYAIRSAIPLRAIYFVPNNCWSHLLRQQTIYFAAIFCLGHLSIGQQTAWAIFLLGNKPIAYHNRFFAHPCILRIHKQLAQASVLPRRGRKGSLLRVAEGHVIELAGKMMKPKVHRVAEGHVIELAGPLPTLAGQYSWAVNPVIIYG